MTVADLFYEREKQNLSPYAFLTCNTRGREHPYVPCQNRTEFQRDRDRIIHSKAFRRLMHKHAGIFVSPVDEHYRTRLTAHLGGCANCQNHLPGLDAQRGSLRGRGAGA